MLVDWYISRDTRKVTWTFTGDNVRTQFVQDVYQFFGMIDNLYHATVEIRKAFSESLGPEDVDKAISEFERIIGQERPKGDGPEENGQEKTQ